MVSSYIAPLIEGFALSVGLIVGIGPQNALVLRQGLCRQHLLLMVLLCTVLDALLIGLGTFGMGALLQGQLPLHLMIYAGVAALLVCGTCSFKAALVPSSASQSTAMLPSRRQLILALLAVSLFNPSVYIDTLLLIGGSASHYQGDQRLWFVLGASAASLVWFLGLSYGSALLAPLLRRPWVLRGLDVLSGGILWWMALRLCSHLE